MNLITYKKMNGIIVEDLKVRFWIVSYTWVLRRIFGPRRDEVTEDWRKLHEVLHNLYSSTNLIRMIKPRRMRWAGHVARMGETRNAYRMLVGKPKRKRPLGRPRCRWVNNIKMNLGEIGWVGMEWFGLAKIETNGGVL
jgi:hypothetical protein